MIALFLSAAAFSEELTEAVVLEGVVSAEGRTFTANKPMYLLPTAVFDSLLADAQKLSVCEGGLEELRSSAEGFEGRVDATLVEARSALVTCSAQVLSMDQQIRRAKTQRNVAYGIAATLVVGGIVGAVAL